MFGSEGFKATCFIKDKERRRGEQVLQPVKRSAAIQEKMDDDGPEIDKSPEMSFFCPEGLSPF